MTSRGRHLDAAAHLDRVSRLIVLGAHEDVGQHVVAVMIPVIGLRTTPRLVEDVAEELEILPLRRPCG